MKMFQNYKIDLVNLYNKGDFDEYSEKYDEANKIMYNFLILRAKLTNKYFSALYDEGKSAKEFEAASEKDKKARKEIFSDPEFIEYISQFDELKGNFNKTLFKRMKFFFKNDVIASTIYKNFFCFHVKTPFYKNVLEEVEREGNAKIADFIRIHPLDSFYIRNNIGEMVGKKLMNVRIDLKLNKDEFSKKTGLEKSVINFLEKNPYRIDANYFEKYAKLLNKEVEDFAKECNLELISITVGTNEFVDYYQISGKQLRRF